ncbi:MAG: antibiotic biosynthesis monooxygenase [Clostridia bacterium]|nr:antibiotic biosynthesis monooxygenase [Clostridia bacterium]
MITMHLFYTGKDDAAERFAQEMLDSGMVNRIRAEEGNLAYAYYRSLDDPHTVLLVDAWENQEALDSHHASPMMAHIMELRERYDLHMRAERLVTEDAAASGDDRRFIRE